MPVIEPERMSMSIREATPADAPILMGLIRELADFEKLSHEVVGTEGQLHDALTQGHSAALIAEVDGAPAGMALYFHNFSTFLTRRGLYLEDLFVRPANRNAGVGRALLKRLAQLAIERQCGRFEWAVLDWNVNALRFYESLGAKPMKEWVIHRLSGDALVAFAGAKG